MRKLLLTAFTTLVWLLASPSLQLRDSGWVEVGTTPAAAEEFRGIMVEEPAKAKKPSKKKAAPKRAKRVGSGGLVTSNQPGFHPMRPIEQPQVDRTVTGTVIVPERDPRYPNVPTVPAIIPETSQQRVVRCTHQGGLGGLSPGQQGTYVHNCAF